MRTACARTTVRITSRPAGAVSGAIGRCGKRSQRKNAHEYGDSINWRARANRPLRFRVAPSGTTDGLVALSTAVEQAADTSHPAPRRFLVAS